MKAQLVSENIRFERGQDPKSAMDLGMLPRIKAAMKSRGYESNTVDQILGFAVDYGHKAFTKFALDNGANPNYNSGRSLGIAVQEGNFEVAEMLLKHGANIDSINNHYTINNIRREALYGGGVKADIMWKIAELLGQYGIEVSAPSPDESVEIKPTPIDSGNSKLKLWVCSCQPKPVHVRVAISDFRAKCLKCGQLFKRKVKSKDWNRYGYTMIL